MRGKSTRQQVMGLLAICRLQTPLGGIKKMGT